MKPPDVYAERILPMPEFPDDVNGEPCWMWMGSKNNGGYGTASFRGKPEMVHRIMYELLKGPLEKRVVLDHLCRVRGCCNPAHLEPVSQSVNLRRGEAGKITGARQKAKTHCAQGHLFDDLNTYNTKGGKRACRECSRIRHKKVNARRKLQRAASKMNNPDT